MSGGEGECKGSEDGPFMSEVPSIRIIHSYQEEVIKTLVWGVKNQEKLRRDSASSPSPSPYTSIQCEMSVFFLLLSGTLE